MHIRNIFREGELKEESVVKDFLTTAANSKRYRTSYFNLDVTISVGYRVKSHRGTQFRIWATQRLREYIIKGFALDDERFEQAGGGNYFDVLHAGEPSPVEQHFVKAVNEVKALEKIKKPKNTRKKRKETR